MAISGRNRFLAVLALACAPLSLMAGPKITVDTADADVGTIIEGQVPIISHAFKIKNTGDSVLRITSVRAG